MISEIKEEEFEELMLSIRGMYGYDFSGYSKSSIYRRIKRFLTNNRIDSIDELKKAITNNEDYFQDFLTELTVNVTEMFRDPLFYKTLRTKVIPKLKTYPHVKVWDAGCSTGEETYSLSIVFKEEGILNKTKIYATDINQKVLKKASEGIYSLAYLKEYSQNYLLSGGKHSFSDYYLAKYNNAIMDSSLSNNFVFAAHNLANDGSFNEFNMIVCRNVMIYFNRQLQERVLELFLNSLCVYGYLILGNKESIAMSAFRNRFEVIDQKERIFRKIS